MRASEQRLKVSNNAASTIRKAHHDVAAILGLAFQNIDRKIRLLYLLHGEREKAVSEIEAFPPLLGYKWRRLLFAVRTSHADALRKLVTISPRLLAAAKGRTGSENPARLAAAAIVIGRIGRLGRLGLGLRLPNLGVFEGELELID